MRITYILLSPTFGMHQYTADIANRMARAGHAVHLVTTARYPAHRYLPAITVHTPVSTRNTGFSLDALQPNALNAIRNTLSELHPAVAHFTGPHLWNLPLLQALRRQGIPTVHTLHDLDPHPGTAYGPLLHLWNRQVLRLADHILIHAAHYARRLVDMNISPAAITCTPLLHLFLGHIWLGEMAHLGVDVTYEPFILFFGRLEKYKGVDHLVTAWAMTEGQVAPDARLVLAGQGDLDKVWAGALPEGIELRNHLIEDAEALDLFRRCALVVLPYLGATQSALIPAAYFFRKPVIAAPSGALHEYVQAGRT
ncbi:MAG: glycosyltransferase family 4 protein, partial [Anaerolineae bacterium]|nr:glycosyltransferase family 4 protein [Anaerolineae bacterium]